MEHLVYYDIAAAFVLLTALVAYHLRKYILIGMVVGGLMYIAFPLLIVGGIIALVTSHS